MHSVHIATRLNPFRLSASTVHPLSLTQPPLQKPRRSTSTRVRKLTPLPSPQGTEVSQNLAAILLNCSSLLQLDLDGVNCLLPALTDAVHHVIASQRPITVR